MQSSSGTLLEALAKAIDGTDEEEAVRLAAEFNSAFRHLVRASVEVESRQGDYGGNLLVPDTPVASTAAKRKAAIVAEKKRVALASTQEYARSDQEDSVEERNEFVGGKKGRKDPEPASSDDTDVKKPKKKKKKKAILKKKQSQDSYSLSSSNPSSDTSSSGDKSSEDSSDDEDAELCYEVTGFKSADLPDLPDKWDKGFRKLRSYVPLTLFNTTLIESFHEEDVELKPKDKLAKLKSSLKALERQLTYGDFIEMCDLEERYAREIYGLDTYADYVVKHKKIVSDLKKTYNCWMIGLRYHIKVRTVIFRRRKLIKSKVKGKTVLKDKVKIPNSLQPMVERQARHDTDRAGDLQHVDNPYTPGGVKFGFSFSTGRAPVTQQIASTLEKQVEDKSGLGIGHRGRRGGAGGKPYVKRPFFGNVGGNRYRNSGNYHIGKQG